MSGGLKYRLVAFILALAGMLGAIAWTAHTSWQRAGELREKLDAVHLQSFQIADHYQKMIFELNNALLRYGVFHDASERTHFDRLSKALDRWVDEQRPILSSEREKQVLDLINTNYDSYLAAARQIEAKVRSQSESAIPLSDFAGFEKQSQRIVNLSFQLAAAHRESMNSFLAKSQKSLSYLRWLLLTLLTLFLLASAGLAVVVYRDLIAPLRLKLVQSQALAERHEKLASLGMLAAGVAHEIRNPLTAIKAWLFLQQKHLARGTPEQADAEIIAGEVNRLEGIVKSVLLFAQPSEPKFTTLPAGQPLREAETLLAPDLEKEHIRLVCEDSTAAQVRVDPQQIKQVLINLIRNAADSIGQNGAITLRVRLGAKRLAESPTDVVILEVADTGKGIPPDVQKRLFDPFFTTKEGGTGLGLSIAARIVEKHGGLLQYQTQVNRGTVFGIVLPRA